MSKFITYPASLQAEYHSNPEVPQLIGFVEAYKRAKEDYNKNFMDTAVVREDNPKSYGFGGYGNVCTRWYAEEAKVEFIWQWYRFKNGGGGYRRQKMKIKYKKS